jgi:hypothetical protein
VNDVEVNSLFIIGGIILLCYVNITDRERESEKLSLFTVYKQQSITNCSSYFYHYSKVEMGAKKGILAVL